MTTKKLLTSIEDVLLFKPIIDKYRHTILNKREVAEEIIKEIEDHKKYKLTLKNETTN